MDTIDTRRARNISSKLQSDDEILAHEETYYAQQIAHQFEDEEQTHIQSTILNNIRDCNMKPSTTDWQSPPEQEVK